MWGLSGSRVSEAADRVQHPPHRVGDRLRFVHHHHVPRLRQHRLSAAEQVRQLALSGDPLVPAAAARRDHLDGKIRGPAGGHPDPYQIQCLPAVGGGLGDDAGDSIGPGVGAERPRVHRIQQPSPALRGDGDAIRDRTEGRERRDLGHPLGTPGRRQPDALTDGAARRRLDAPVDQHQTGDEIGSAPDRGLGVERGHRVRHEDTARVRLGQLGEGRRLLGQGGQVVRPRGAAQARPVEPDQLVTRQQPGDGIPGVRGHPAPADQDHRRPAARLDDHVDRPVAQPLVVLRRDLSHDAAPGRARRRPHRRRPAGPPDDGGVVRRRIRQPSPAAPGSVGGPAGSATHPRSGSRRPAPGSAEPCSGSIRSTATR